jgi:hypothetical protein
MTIHQDNTALTFRVTDYQFPDVDKGQTGFDYDANWLNIEILYSDSTGSYRYLASCIMTVELMELIEGINDVIDGRKFLYISDFMEPFLKFVVGKLGQSIAIGIEFIYDTTDVWKSHGLCEALSLQDAKMIANELHRIYEQYPER